MCGSSYVRGLISVASCVLGGMSQHKCNPCRYVVGHVYTYVRCSAVWCSRAGNWPSICMRTRVRCPNVLAESYTDSSNSNVRFAWKRKGPSSKVSRSPLEPYIFGIVFAGNLARRDLDGHQQAWIDQNKDQIKSRTRGSRMLCAACGGERNKFRFLALCYTRVYRGLS
jgi:hypothetical protein